MVSVDALGAESTQMGHVCGHVASVKIEIKITYRGGRPLMCELLKDRMVCPLMREWPLRQMGVVGCNGHGGGGTSPSLSAAGSVVGLNLSMLDNAGCRGDRRQCRGMGTCWN